jgi:hypothetical protein
MNKKTAKHPTPEVYRIIMRCGKPPWKTKSERYFTAFHSSEALEDLYHTFHTGKMHAEQVIIYDIQEYDRYSHLWVSRFNNAIENIENFDIDTVKIKKDSIKLKRG